MVQTSTSAAPKRIDKPSRKPTWLALGALIATIVVVTLNVLYLVAQPQNADSRAQGGCIAAKVSIGRALAMSSAQSARSYWIVGAMRCPARDAEIDDLERQVAMKESGAK